MSVVRDQGLSADGTVAVTVTTPASLSTAVVVEAVLTFAEAEVPLRTDW
jgi:hypothetical protein